MSKLILILAIFVICLSCEESDSLFPERQSVLVKDFKDYENFFPIATIDLSDNGFKDKIHIMYVCFDPEVNHSNLFPNNDNIDEFTFEITKNGLYRPKFDKSALKIGKDFEKFFDEYREKYVSVKSKNENSVVIEFAEEPEWWQFDQTPLNSKGEKMKFICQIDMYEITHDDCRLYIFYDVGGKQIKYVHQRD